MTSTQQTDAYRFFAIAFGAAPGVEYMNQIAQAYEGGSSTKQIVNEFTKKSVFTNTYPIFLTNEQFADRLINNVVGSAATDAAKTEAKADVVTALNGGATRGDTIFAVFSNLAKLTGDAKWGDTAAKMANQVAVARYYTETLLKSSTDVAVLRAVLSGVDKSTDVSNAALDARLNPPAPGQTFTLTTGTDSVTGSAGNDTINAPLAGTAGATLTYSALDQIDGGAGTDSLYVENNAASVNLALVKNVENVAISNSSAGATVTLPNDKAATGLTNIGSTANFAFTNVASGATSLTLSGTGATTTTLDYTSTALNGSADTLALNLSAAAGSTVAFSGSNTTTNNLETVALNTSANSTVTLNLANTAATSVTVAGAGTTGLTINNASAQFKSVNASAATGAVTVGAVGQSTTVTGGSGNDNLTAGGGNDVVLGGAGADTITGGAGNDSLDGGAGNDTVAVALDDIGEFDTIVGGDGTDTLSVSGTLSHSTTATTVQPGTRISGFEAIRATGTASVDMTAVAAGNTITSVVIDGGALTLSKDTTVTGVTFLSAHGATVESAGTQSVTIGQASGTTGITTGTFTTKGTTLNVASANTLPQSELNTLALASTNATVATVNLSGDDRISLTGGTVISKIDASAVTATAAAGAYAVTVSTGTSTTALTFIPGAGAVSVTTSGGADTLTGTAGNDLFAAGNGNNSVTGGAGNDTVSSGTGNDIISLGDGNDSVTDSGDGNDNISGGNGNDTVSAFAGNDTLDGGDGNDNLTGGDGADSIVGGNGADTLSDGNGNDVISGGDGNDSITLGAGIDNVDGGNGADTITSANTVGAGDTINGGDGSDTLTITGISGTARPTLTSIETINLTFGAAGTFGVKNVTDSSAKTFTVDASAGAGAPLAVTLGDLVTGSTVNISDDATYLGTADDTTGDIGALTIDMADNSLASLTVNVNATNNSAAGPSSSAFTGTTVTDAGDVTVNSAGGTTSNRVTNTLGSLSLNSDVTALTLKANDNSGLTTGAVTGAGVQTLSLTSGAASTLTFSSLATATALSSITATAAGSASRVIIGAAGAGNDIGSGTAAVLKSISLTATGGATIDVDGSIASAATALDTLTISATDRGSKVDFAGTTMSVKSVGTSATITANALTTVNPGTLSIGGTTKALTVTVGADAALGAMTVTGTGAIEKVTYSVDTNATSVGTQAFGATAITELSVTMGGTSNYVFNAAASGDLTAGGVAVLTTTAAGAGTIDLAAATKGTLNFGSTSGTVTIDLSDVDSGAATTPFSGAWALTGGTGADNITGGSGNDTITGNAGNDALVGGAGNDSIVAGDGTDNLTGGTGTDTMTGNSGADTFIFAAGASGTPSDTVFDTITDYTTNLDVIDFGATAIVQFATATTAASGTAGVTSAGIVSFNSADSTLALRVTAVANAIAGAAAGNALIFGFGSDSYIYITDGTAGAGANDVLIKLTGVANSTSTDTLTIVGGDITGLA
jgi:Ca2+-binding RTX toxin-like protein